MEQKDLEVIDNMVGQLDQSARWERILATDPMVQKSHRELDAILNDLPETVYDAVYSYVADISRAAMLYGMWVMCSLQDVLSDPAQLGQFILNRMKS